MDKSSAPMPIQAETHRPDTVPYRMLLGLLVLIIALVLGIHTLMERGYRSLGEQAIDQPQQTLLFRLIIQGQAPLVLDVPGTQQFIDDLQLHNTRLEQAAQQHLALWQQQRLAQFMAQAESPIDHYLDWYYSLGGSYLRLLIAISGDLDSLLSDRMQRLIFEQGGLDQQMTRFLHQLQRDYPAALYDFLAQQQAVDLEQLTENYRQRYPVDERNEYTQFIELDLRQPLQDLFNPEQQRFEAYFPVAAAGLITAPASSLAIRYGLLGKLRNTPTALAASRATRRYLSRLPIQLSARAAVSAQAAAAAAPSGPIALAIGASVFAAGIGVDWAMLKAEEASYREGQKREFLQLIEGELQQQLLAITQAQAAYFQAGKQAIDET